MAYLDVQLAPRQMESVGTHLAQCDRCRNCLAQLQVESDRSAALLEPYRTATLGRTRNSQDGKGTAQRCAPALKDNEDGCPLCRVKDPAWVSETGLLDALSQSKRGVDYILKRYQGYMAAAAAVVVLAGLLSIGPVRSLAAQALQVFRVNQVQVLHFNPADVQQLQSALQANGQKIDTASFGTFTRQQLQDCSLVDANTATVDGRQIAFPGSIGAYTRTGSLQLTQGTQLLATPKVSGINSFLTSLGSKSLLPASLDGQTFTVQIPGCASATFEQAGSTATLVLLRSLSPALTVPSGVDVDQVRQALLAIPILPEDMRNTLAGVNINSGTLLVPDFGITSRGGSIESTTINGNQGVLITPPPGGGHTGPLSALKPGVFSRHQINGNVLIWPQGGVWNALEGNFTLDQGVALASSI
jgi:hypothetical protein